MKKVIFVVLSLLVSQYASAEHLCIENIKKDTMLKYNVIVKKPNHKPDSIRIWQPDTTKFLLEFSKNKKGFKNEKVVSYLKNTGMYVNMGSLDADEYASKCQNPTKIGSKKNQSVSLKSLSPIILNVKVNEEVKNQ